MKMRMQVDDMGIGAFQAFSRAVWSIFPQECMIHTPMLANKARSEHENYTGTMTVSKQMASDLAGTWDRCINSLKE